MTVSFAGFLISMLSAAAIGGVVASWLFKRDTVVDSPAAGQPLLVPMDITINLSVIRGDGFVTVESSTDLHTSEMSNDLVMAWLDREGMIAMPKGFDFGKKAKAKP